MLLRHTLDPPLKEQPEMTKIYFLPDRLELGIRDDQTILDAALQHRLGHTHSCGGQGRCSTCRVLILDGIEHCTPADATERAIAERMRFGPSIRLACRTRVTNNVRVRRLVLDEYDKTLTSLIDEPVSAGPVGEEREIAVLFSDIAGFTPFAENLPAYDVIHVLNRYFHQMDRIITRFGGRINNYMGDGLIALFGVDDNRQAPLEAVQAGMAMLAALDQFSPYLRELYQASFRIRIGVHYGEVVLGELGSPKNKRMTAIGDAVNLASRIETANKGAGTQFLISQETLAPISRHVQVGKTIEVELPGKSGIHKLYEVVGVTDAPPEEIGAFQA